MLCKADQLTRIYARPTEYENEFSLVIAGHEVDFESLFAGREAAIIKFVKDWTNRPELEFGKMRWLSEWRSVQPYFDRIDTHSF